jgi:hypothetical protein
VRLLRLKLSWDSPRVKVGSFRISALESGHPRADSQWDVTNYHARQVFVYKHWQLHGRNHFEILSIYSLFNQSSHLFTAFLVLQIQCIRGSKFKAPHLVGFEVYQATPWLTRQSPSNKPQTRMMRWHARSFGMLNPFICSSFRLFNIDLQCLVTSRVVTDQVLYVPKHNIPVVHLRFKSNTSLGILPRWCSMLKRVYNISYYRDVTSLSNYVSSFVVQVLPGCMPAYWNSVERSTRLFNCAH